MVKYIVFAGKSGGVNGFYRVIGYLEALADQRILQALTIKSGEMWKPEDIALLFFGDKKIKHILQSLSQKLPERYEAFRAEVINEKEAESGALRLRERAATYGANLEYRIYDS